MSKEKKQYDKILVVAQTADKVVRYKFENQLVQDFALLGIKAIPSKEVIHSDLFEKELSEQDIETLKNQLKQDGYSGVVVTNLINTNNYADVVSGGVSTGYLPVRYGRFRSCENGIVTSLLPTEFTTSKVSGAVPAMDLNF